MVENLQSEKYELKRPDNGEKYKYHMIKHSHEKSNPKNRDRLDFLKHWKNNALKDGLNVSIAPPPHHPSAISPSLKIFSEFKLHAGEREFQKILCQYNCRFAVRASWTMSYDSYDMTHIILLSIPPSLASFGSH